MSGPLKGYRWVALAVGLSAMALAVGCGSDNDKVGAADSGSTTQATGTASAPAPVQGKPFVIGTICTCSGPLGTGGFSLTKDVLQAWVSYTNTHGGVNGHPVKLVFKDDQGDAAKAALAARQLVENDKVLAVVGSNSTVGDTFAKYLSQKGVPVVGPPWFALSSFTDPNWYSTGTSYVTAFDGLVRTAQQQGHTKIATVFCSESPTCAVVGKVTDFVTKNVVPGTQQVAALKVGATQPNYTSQCLALQRAGAQAYYLGLTSAVIERVIADCDRQRVPGKPILTGGLTYSDAGLPGMDGVSSTENNLPIAAWDQTAGGRKLKTVLGDIVDNKSFSGVITGPLSGMELFKVAAERAKLTPTSTPADLKRGLYAIKDETLGGLSAPLTYTKGKPFNVNCWFVDRVANGKWTSDGKPKCVPQSEVAKIGAALLGK